MPNLFDSLIEDAGELKESIFLEAEGDPPAEGNNEPPPAQDMPVPEMDSAPDPGGPPEMGDLSEPSMSGDGGMEENPAGDMGGGENGQQQQEEVPLDEKGEIFAKVEILKNYNHLYQTIQDTLNLIDRIDLVQIGNKINSTDITDIKEKLSDLMEDVYVTIVYEFQMAYKNLKVKLVGYSSRYILTVNQLNRMIRKDQSMKGE